MFLTCIEYGKFEESERIKKLGTFDGFTKEMLGQMGTDEILMLREMIAAVIREKKKRNKCGDSEEYEAKRFRHKRLR